MTKVRGPRSTMVSARASCGHSVKSTCIMKDISKVKAELESKQCQKCTMLQKLQKKKG